MPTSSLEGHLALVTGGTGGIGAATCLTLASHGFSIAIHYNSNSTKAEELLHELRSNKNVRAEAFQADMGDYEQVRKLHAEVTKNGRADDPVQ